MPTDGNWNEAHPYFCGDCRSLTDLQIVRRFLTAITDNLIFDRLTFIERAKAGTFDSGDMDEHVSAAVLGLNESIALRRVEPFDSAGSHHGLLEINIIGPHDHHAIAHPKSALSWGNASRDARQAMPGSNLKIILVLTTVQRCESSRNA